MSGHEIEALVREMTTLHREVVDEGLRVIELRQAGRHWLLFNDAREITGCHCGFAADLDSDCGWGDSVVKHLLAVGR